MFVMYKTELLFFYMLLNNVLTAVHCACHDKQNIVQNSNFRPNFIQLLKDI